MICVFLQINISDERGSPDVICESKLLYAPPTSQDRIAGLAWQVVFVFKFEIHIETFMMWLLIDQNKDSERSRTLLDETVS
jgi:hypothetical protein